MEGVTAWRALRSTGTPWVALEGPGPHPNPTDAAMARYAAGDEEAFVLVYDELAPRLFGFLLRKSRNTARAEDLLQQTFLRMHRARSRFTPGSEVTPWAFAIARRLFIDAMRGERRDRCACDPDAGERLDGCAGDDAADELVHARQLARRVQDELESLPEKQRAAFELVKLDGLSLAEAAQVLGTSVGAVKLRVHRAYVALRVVLGDQAAPREGASK